MMKRFAYVCGLVLAWMMLLFTAEQSCAQGTLQWTVTFDAIPIIPREHIYGVTYYKEESMEFRPIGNGQFSRAGGGRDGFAENGTAYLMAGFGDSLSITSINGQRFGLVSVDLAEFSTLYQIPLTVQFIGYKPGGSITIVTAEFVTDGIIDGTGPLTDFQTFYFDSQFNDLEKVEIPNYGWSLDNMVFCQVPEPSISVLLLAVSLLFAGLKFAARSSAGVKT